jgi:hypothetical protein
VCFQNFLVELNYLPETPVIFSLPPSLGAHGANPAGTALAPLSTILPRIPDLPQSRQPFRLAITAVRKITLMPETGEPRKIPFSPPSLFS